MFFNIKILVLIVAIVSVVIWYNRFQTQKPLDPGILKMTRKDAFVQACKDTLAQDDGYCKKFLQSYGGFMER